MSTLKLSGITSAGGGVYEKVKIEGVANLGGEITCDEMIIQGVSSFAEGITCKTLTLEGTCKIKGSIKAGKCQLSGLLSVDGEMEAETIDGTGSFKVGGSVNAEKIDVRFVFGASAEEVLGETIRIRKESASGTAEFLLDLIPWRHKGRNFQCKLIEGDRVDVEHVECAAVRGQQVTIGPGCKVDLVEYHQCLAVDPKASVGKSIQLGE